MADIETIPGVLACDVGNTAIHLACVKGDQVTPTRSLRVGELSGLGATLAEMWREISPPRKLVACSVNPAALRALEAAATATIGEAVLVVGRDLPLPIDTNLSDPAATGTDRLCAAAAAFDRLGVACVVADYGTAITIDCVNDAGVFQGGAILPGLALAAKSLQAGTAQLPAVELSNPDWVFGKDTRQAIVGGLVFAARGTLKELVEAYATELGHWPIVILTGSDAALVCGEVQASELVQAIVPDLVLRGVAAAYYRTLLK
ncbi:MAG: type III pantothenate kinase [Phycisphaerae bacterium]|jgi:type III pantothenate kinase